MDTGFNDCKAKSYKTAPRVAARYLAWFLAKWASQTHFLLGHQGPTVSVKTQAEEEREGEDERMRASPHLLGRDCWRQCPHEPCTNVRRVLALTELEEVVQPEHNFGAVSGRRPNVPGHAVTFRVEASVTVSSAAAPA